MNEVQLELELDLVIADKYDRRRAALEINRLHYSDRIIQALVARGWYHDKSDIGEGRILYKEILVSDSYIGLIGAKSRVITIVIDENFRYFRVLSGFGVAFVIDGRNFDFKPKAAAKLLDEYVERMYA